MDKLFIYILILLGILGIADTLFVISFSSMNFGNCFPGFLGIILILWATFYDKIKFFLSHGKGIILKYLIVFGILFFAITFLTAIFTINKYSSTLPKNKSDAIIVLGAGLNGDRVSKTLSLRLDKAYDYFQKNTDNVIVVSGGQGPGELITEAQAMKDYLLQKGVPNKNIILEDKSTSTKENFLFSKKILDEYFSGNDYSVVYVTNDFHVYRAGLIAKDAGLNAEGLSSKSYQPLLPNFYIREYFSIIKYFLIK